MEFWSIRCHGPFLPRPAFIAHAFPGTKPRRVIFVEFSVAKSNETLGQTHPQGISLATPRQLSERGQQLPGRNCKTEKCVMPSLFQTKGYEMSETALAPALSRYALGIALEEKTKAMQGCRWFSNLAGAGGGKNMDLPAITAHANRKQFIFAPYFFGGGIWPAGLLRLICGTAKCWADDGLPVGFCWAGAD